MRTITYTNKAFPNLEFDISYRYEDVSIEKIVITNYDKEDLYDLLYLGEGILDDIEEYILELEREKR